MADLDAAQRNKMPKSEFGEPGERKYPMPDRSHAADAKGRAEQMLKRGVISKSAYDKIMAKADRVLGEKGGAKKPSGKTEGKSEPKPKKEAAADDRQEGDMSEGADGASKDEFYRSKGGKPSSDDDDEY